MRSSEPFKNSPSIDSLHLLSIHSPSEHPASRTPSPRSHGQALPSTRRRSVLSRQGEILTAAGHPSVGSEVPVDLLQSVILPSSLQDRLDLHESSRGWVRSRSNTTAAADGQPKQPPPASQPHTAAVETSPQGLLPAAVPSTPHSRTLPPTSDSFSPFAGQELPSSWTRAIAYTPSLSFPPVRYLGGAERKRVLVTGGAGFVGSHLVDRLMFMGHDVTVLDNFFTGHKTALSHWIGHPNFELVRHDVVDPFMIECDQIYHLACPASPIAYQYNAIKTLKTNFSGTMNMLGLAKRVKARFLLSSTSEVYGSPEQHPQKESYWGNVNPIGPRACYDEGKRVAEALAVGYARENAVDVRVARIFNTFGPRMSSTDGRVVSNFICRALRGEPLEVYGDGSQTRSLMYIHDLVDGLILLMNVGGKELVVDARSGDRAPVNLGSQDEATILEWAETIVDVVDQVKSETGIKSPKSEIVFKEPLADDPPKRRPDTTRAKDVLGWQMRWTVRDGLLETSRFFAAVMAAQDSDR